MRLGCCGVCVWCWSVGVCLLSSLACCVVLWFGLLLFRFACVCVDCVVFGVVVLCVV